MKNRRQVQNDADMKRAIKLSRKTAEEERQSREKQDVEELECALKESSKLNESQVKTSARPVETRGVPVGSPWGFRMASVGAGRAVGAPWEYREAAAGVVRLP